MSKSQFFHHHQTRPNKKKYRICHLITFISSLAYVFVLHRQILKFDVEINTKSDVSDRRAVFPSFHSFTSQNKAHKIFNRNQQEKGYIRPTEFNQNLYNGRVMSELCGRVLSRNISQANVLVVSPDIISTHPTIRPINSSTYIIGDGPASVVLAHSLQEHHRVYTLSPLSNLKSWWRNVTTQENNSSTTGNDIIPSWLLLAYFIPAQSSHYSIDQLLHPSRVNDLMQGTTITYIIFQVEA